MVNPKLQHLIDTDELDWDDPRHRERYLREWVNKNGHAFLDEDDQEEAEVPLHSSLTGNDNEDTSTGCPQA
jgi:hypothetical protein